MDYPISWPVAANNVQNHVTERVQIFAARDGAPIALVTLSSLQLLLRSCGSTAPKMTHGLG
jgi:hypothetical protein